MLKNPRPKPSALLTLIFVFNILPKNTFAEDEIVLGQSAAFSGASAALGSNLYVGADAYLKEVNSKGGVNGRKIRVIAMDDAYDGDRTLANTISLVNKSNVFALFGYVGTPTIVKALPVIQKFHADQGIFLFSNFTGAQPQREPPHDKYVFNIRASYRQETEGLVKHLVEIGKRRIGVFIQDDAYGKSGADGTERALNSRGLKTIAEATYPRGTHFGESLQAQAKILVDAKVDAVISVGAYAACAAFIRDIRNLGFDGPIANVSFVGPSPLLALLQGEGVKVQRDYTSNLINSQVVPPFADVSFPLSKEFADSMSKFKPTVPADLNPSGHVEVTTGFGALEGYLNAKVFVSILKRIKGKVTRDSFIKTAESMTSMDVGMKSTKLSFGPNRHRGLDKVFYTTIENGQYVLIKDWKAFK